MRVGQVAKSAFAVALCIAAVTGCQDVLGGAQADFVGPADNSLSIVSAPTCPGGEPPGSRIDIGGANFLPGTPVDLRWSVELREVRGTWRTVAANDSGDFATTVTLPKGDLQVGDKVALLAQGAGETGLMALQNTIIMVRC